MSNVLIWGVFIGIILAFTMGLGALASSAIDIVIENKKAVECEE